MSSELSRLKVGLAPMEGVTDFATRLWITQNGAPDFTTTPFLRVTKDYPPKRISANFLPEIQLSKEHGIVTCIPQLMASDEDDLIRIGHHFLKSVPFVDVNCGCPSPTVVGNGAGSSLLQDPQRFSDYLRKIVDTLGPQKVSVKMRLGFNHEIEFSRLLEVLAPLPLARLTIHGRTRADRYTGKARWSFIAKAAQEMPFPVFGSGDVSDLDGFQERVSLAPALAGVIIGRGALRDPWIFARFHNPQLRVSREQFRSRLLQYVLLQELQSNYWSSFFAAIQNGAFKTLSADSYDDLQTSKLLLSIPELHHWRSDEPKTWEINRVSVARGKMLWNYLRSGVEVAPELTVGLLRAASWTHFIDALDKIVSAAADEDIGLRYRPEWDWVYAGAGSDSVQR